jgi:hypothetical protein
MLSQFQNLSITTDGRFASDEELQFAESYARTFAIRADAYRKIKETERVLVEQVQSKLQARYPDVFTKSGEDLSAKWKQDTIRVLRYSAITVLLDDPKLLRDQFLYWFQTIMQAFGTEQICNATYALMQDVARQVLPSEVANLLCPVLELNRSLLSATGDRNT